MQRVPTELQLNVYISHKSSQNDSFYLEKALQFSACYLFYLHDNGVRALSKCDVLRSALQKHPENRKWEMHIYEVETRFESQLDKCVVVSMVVWKSRSTRITKTKTKTNWNGMPMLLFTLYKYILQMMLLLSNIIMTTSNFR